MKAVILAAGYGRRMRPLTHTTHKTLLSINGKPLIAWIIDALLAHHIHDLAIVTGYLAAQLRHFIAQRYPQLTIHYIHNERYAETNNIFSMALAMETLASDRSIGQDLGQDLDQDLLLIECDLIFEPGVLSRLLKSPYPNAALVDRYQPGMDGTVVEINRDQVITAVIPPHLQSDTFDFTDKYKTLNIYRFSKDFCQGDFSKLLTHYARTIDSNAYYEIVLGLLIYLQRNTIHAVILQGDRWSEIDDPNDLNVAKFLFEPHQRQSLLSKSHGGYWNYPVLDFCYLRNMHFPTSAVISELRNNLPALIQNYGSCQALLNQKLAYFLLCDPERVSVLNGAAQIFPFLQRHFGDRPAWIPAPTFGEYSRIFPQAIPYADPPDLGQLSQQIPPGSLLLWVNPNNPTGTTLPTAALYDFAANHPQVTIGIDESFIDFSGQPSLQTWLDKAPLSNLFIIKSLSKVLGIPGLRLGYLYSTHRPLHQALQATLPIWNLNALAEHFLELLLKHRSALAASFIQTQQDRAHLAQLLKDLPLVEAVSPSGGNFLHVTCTCPPTDLRALTEQLLARHNIYLKDISTRFADGDSHLRVAVRLPHEHQALVARIQALELETL